MIGWVVGANAAGASPTVFSVMEKLVSDAWRMDYASGKRVLVQQTAVSTGKTIVLIVETMFSMAVKIVSAIEKMFLVSEKIFSAIEKMFFVSEKIFSAIEKMFFAFEKIFSAFGKMFSIPKSIFLLPKTMVGMVDQSFAHISLELIEQSFANPAGCFWSTSPLAPLLTLEIHHQVQLSRYNLTVFVLRSSCQAFFLC